MQIVAVHLVTVDAVRCDASANADEPVGACISKVMPATFVLERQLPTIAGVEPDGQCPRARRPWPETRRPRSGRQTTVSDLTDEEVPAGAVVMGGELRQWPRRIGLLGLPSLTMGELR